MIREASGTTLSFRTEPLNKISDGSLGGGSSASLKPEETVNPGLPFENQIVIVTGASKLEPMGIGAATALEFARQGAAAVIITGTDRPDTQGPDVRDAIEATGGTRALWLPGDIKNPKTVVELIARVKGTYGHVDTLVNNAGIIKDNKTEKMPVEDWDDVLDTNVRPAFLTVQEMLKQAAYDPEGDGSVVNVGSIVGIYGNEGQDNYTSAKAAIAGLTRTQAKSLGSIGYRVNGVAPGLIDTEMTHKKLVERIAIRTAAEALTPVGRVGKPGEVADVIVFLASKKASFVNGQIIEVDGGLGGKIGAVSELSRMNMQQKAFEDAKIKSRRSTEDLQAQVRELQTELTALKGDK